MAQGIELVGGGMADNAGGWVEQPGLSGREAWGAISERSILCVYVRPGKTVLVLGKDKNGLLAQKQWQK